MNFVNMSQFDFPVQAYLINYDDQTYSKVRYDAKSIEAFKNNMHKIKDPLARNEIWNQLWYHINDYQMTSLEFIDFAISQLPHQTQELTLKTILKNL